MAIVDADMHDERLLRDLQLHQVSTLLTHALEAYASMMATDYHRRSCTPFTQDLSSSISLACYDNGMNEPVAREKMAHAATMAGMAFANAFLGVCHSMAHKLGAFHHVPHGIANALMLEQVIRFNCSRSSC